MSDFTKIALGMALDDLLYKKSFSDVTVSDITKRAGVNRQTFYYHFKNVYDLLKWYSERQVQDFMKDCEDKKLSWDEKLLNLGNLIREKAPIIINAYKTIDSKTFMTFLNILVVPVVDDVIDAKANEFFIDDSTRHKIEMFLTYGFIGYFFSRIENDDVVNVIEKKDILDFIDTSMDAILSSRCVRKYPQSVNPSYNEKCRQ